MSHAPPANEDASELNFLQRWLPHPLLTLVLVLLWMTLLNSFTVGGLLMGTILGVIIPIYTAQFWPERPPIGSPLLILPFLIILIFDVIVANIQVAYLILFRKSAQLHGGWISVPLDLTSPEAITVLSATITLTPGTIACDVSTDGRSLLVHCLDASQEDQLTHRIKHRYERRIKAILS